MHDQQFYKYISNLPDYSVIAFDKAYLNYKQFEAFTTRNIFYVLRQKSKADYVSTKEFELSNEAQHILKDERIEITHKDKKEEIKQQMRTVVFFS